LRHLGRHRRHDRQLRRTPAEGLKLPGGMTVTGRPAGCPTYRVRRDDGLQGSRKLHCDIVRMLVRR
ncbi:hypothetical protein NK983_24955, partial [Salmonella enterica subsp. enterica serovar Typhimurium]|nr:hypothetical protein [Salmonella enterica subsp. enterica serovar Typhimurium]